MAISKINGVPLTRTITPVGLIRGREQRTINDVELKATLDKAVEDAGLNVTERMALNKEFFPNGGGFQLFPENVIIPKYTYYYKKGSLEMDEFSKEVSSTPIPESVCRIDKSIRRSSKGCFEKNLENALKKLKNVLEGNM